MVSNLVKRIISGVILGTGVIFTIFHGGIPFQLLMMICAILMLQEWYSINSNKKSLLFFAGFVYLVIPMVFWIVNSVNFPEACVKEVLWCFLIVWACDIFAYFGGKLIGGPKFSPRISPNKTWSGVFVGGTMALIASYLYIFNFWNAKFELVIMSVFMIVASVLGDLLESKVKRVLNVKDSGNLIPGHGGVCDRLDSFLLVTYVFILIKIFFL